jgi:hypothetical protein
MKITFDTNCIIEIDENRPAAKYLREIVELGETTPNLILQISAISACEKQMDGTFLEKFSHFRERLDKLGMEKVEILCVFMIWGMGFWYDNFLWPTTEMVNLEKSIHYILFPNINHEYDESELDVNSKSWLKWVNAECDILALWSHIYYNGDIFVTLDENFLKSKKNPLEALGAKMILKPEDALKIIRPSLALCK